MTRHSMWGGRFHTAPADILKKLNDSLSFDAELLDQEIEASLAWAKALAASGVLTARETEQISAVLESLRGNTPAAGEAEDVHSWVEARLVEKLGNLGKKIHTGRSRNDQVATDVRLYLRRAFEDARVKTLDLSDALTRRAGQEAATPMPGYTHMKGAEPITFGHWCLAYVEMLLRDADRFASAAERADECPLGSGALAGTPLPMDRQALAESLGFARASANSLDAVSDRDAIAEYLFCASLLLVHLSRLSEDLILFSSDEFAFVELPDELATGSSRMPHKKNPDVLELTRGHAARAIGEVTGMLALLKGLPLAYNKDLQLDKEPMFRLSATLGAILPVISAVVAGLKLDRERMRVAASSDLLLATAAADALATSGVSFRDAHEMVGKAIAAGGSRGHVALEENPTVESALSAKAAFGGTAPERVREAAAKAADRIAKGRQGR